MTISAVLHPGAIPAIDVTVTASGTMTAVTLYRIAEGVTTRTHIQPAPGAASRTVTDYLAPWDTDIAYSVTYTVAGSQATETFGVLQLSSTSAWIINPNSPELSLEADSGDPTRMGIVAISDVVLPTTATVHQILGARLPVVTTVGSRLAPQFTVTVATVTQAEESALRAIVDDQTPLLIRIPAVLGANWDDGYYHVSDVTIGRIIQYAGEPRRTFTLPMIQVAEPAPVTAETWDYPTLTSTYADYGSLTAAYADYRSLTADERVA